MSFTPYYYVISRPEHSVRKRRPILLAVGLLVMGVALIGWAGMPIMWYQFVQSPKFGQRSYISPVAYNLTAAVQGSDSSKSDIRDVDAWFPAAPQANGGPGAVTSYTLAIPKLGIQGAEVFIGGHDLAQHLIHYGGTATPGLPGSAVVFGHSVLPQFFNPENYMTIFSTLHTMNLGDVIVVNYDGIQYQYQVVDMFEVQPDEISVLDQEYQDKHLLLITCTPPGTYLRRLVVKSKLIPTADSYYGDEATSN